MVLQVISSFKGQTSNGTLYLVPTPIGNLGDMTSRAIEVLGEVDLIAAEDTRNTQKLLNHFNISTKQISFHEHNTQERIPKLVEKLKTGINIAQVSDAGMPSISDPGHELVEACIKEDIPVVPLPGANAGITALIASGLIPQPFYFYGFLPRKNSEQKQELTNLKGHTSTIIFYEAPHRLKKTLKNMSEVLGNREVVLCRELTKKFEEFIRGNLEEVIEWANTSEIRGEFVIILDGNHDEQAEESKVTMDLSIEDQVRELIENRNLKPNQAIKEVAKENRLKKQKVYNLYHHLD
ncbi:16S rRNA (cytidine(1402)-2'-O)-methyltransferase [Ligilactobacillus salivarius]|uniref:16S rRNA (cytidine(1402)-2'-O)-methyltransferase n=1 Tax=Ligilactobacillus salivarius TaxID=1624 RepID=UPI00136B609D|nr:16S rRNA (cytidine(1402)-2'-O)-methyltransferase [Ligilactobacillus salivarius]MYY76775.1 16S rRNA (cytidine(1402)-2'-O)-methyltransferase [Ligilactobacillus salivarius]MYZ62501.1 16S rRNA (cytidine(1402)-2'-O)-methyltransferase [Ligilactobacillus salivarius]